MHRVVHFRDGEFECVFVGLRAEVADALVSNPDRCWTGLELTALLRERGMVTASTATVTSRLNELVKIGIAERREKRPCSIGRRRKTTWRFAEGAAAKLSVEVVR